MPAARESIRLPKGSVLDKDSGRRLWRPLSLCEALGAEFGGQAIGGRPHEPGVALQRLIGQPPDRAGNTERADHLAGEIEDRNRDTADLGVEFAIVERDAGAP